ncbi:acyl transferase/acyl hydrolase/lysophospholipase [Chytriomyces cf. hyalinus JEL632]|nr:acyl transferase/acyl hydrolase/lysophospholipase [Chytriomyces cf. hyalinus JEL632]
MYSDSQTLTPKLKSELLDRLDSATTYAEWLKTATYLDSFQSEFANTAISPIYDHNLIRDRFDRLRAARTNAANGNPDYNEIVFNLRSGLLRNLGALNDLRLYSVLYTGTKRLIEDYHKEVVANIKVISQHHSDPERKRIFIRDTRQSFGCTALILHGGSTFALSHLGVAKALFENGLLPRIVSGSSISALIASLICVHTDEELSRLFDSTTIDLSAFEKRDKKSGWKRKLWRFISTGYLLDSTVFEDVVVKNLGDITFEEAFQRTNRILNITVRSTRTNEVPRLLNYLTAPTVVIRTAACASSSALGLFKSADLKVKTNSGELISWGGSEIEWSDSNIESPELKLSELFNVNHFIVSQSSPLAAPFLPKAPQQSQNDWLQKFMSFLFGEFRHRVHQLAHFGWVPATVAPLFSNKILGHVTISPSPTIEDFYAMFSNPSRTTLQYWLSKGEKCTWPYIGVIRNRTMVELALDAALRECRKHDAKLIADRSANEKGGRLKPPPPPRRASFDTR